MENNWSFDKSCHNTLIFVNTWYFYDCLQSDKNGCQLDRNKGFDLYSMFGTIIFKKQHIKINTMYCAVL